MSWTDWLTAAQPKIKGTWHLHNALLEQQPNIALDCFFLFSSAGAISGQFGQANYNAGNTFLDSFVSYRHQLGLPASSLSIGVMGDVGYVAENAETGDALRATGQWFNTEPDLLECIELALKRSQPAPLEIGAQSGGGGGGGRRMAQKAQLGMGLKSNIPITSPACRVLWRKDRRMLVYRNLEAQQDSSAAARSGSPSSSNDQVAQFIREASANMAMLKGPDTAEFLAREIGKTLLAFMMKSDSDLDLGAPLATVGIDSLISVELRSWMRRWVGAELTTLEIMRCENLRALGVAAQGKLVEKYKSRA